MSSPLSLFRKNQRILLAVFGVLIMIVFVIGGSLVQFFQSQGQPGQTDGRNRVVMAWNGGVVREGQVQLMRRQHLRLVQFLEAVARETTEKGRTPQAEVIRPVQSERELLQRMLLAEKARDLGVVVSDQAVLDYLFELADFQANPEDPAATTRKKAELARLLRDSTEGELSQPAMFDRLREELLARQMQMMAFSGVSFPPGQVVTPGKAWDYFTRLRKMVSTEIAPLEVASYTSEVRDPTDAEVKQLYEEYKGRIDTPASPEPGFRQPLRLQFGYVQGAMEAYLEEEMERLKPTITDQAIEEYYEKNKSDYLIEEEPGDSEPPAGTPASETPPPEQPEPPSDEKPAEEKPAEEKPADDKPAEEKPADEKPADEKPAEEKPAEEKPVEEKPADEIPSEEQPSSEADSSEPADEPKANDASATGLPLNSQFVALQQSETGETDEPAEEKPAEEQPTEEKPAEEQPTEEKPAEEKPAEEKPAEEKPAEKKPAEEKPAEEKPAEEQPTEEKPAEEKPAEEKPAEEKPAEEKPEPEYRPLDEALREEIRAELARQEAAPLASERLDRVLQAARTAVEEYSLLRPVEATPGEAKADENFPPLDLKGLAEAYADLAKSAEGEALAKEFQALLTDRFGKEIAEAIAKNLLVVMREVEAGRLQVGQTEPLGPFDVQEHELGRTFDFSGGQFRSFGQIVFGREMPLYKVNSIRSFESDSQYLYWKIDELAEQTPPLSEIREEVVEAWKLQEARKLALAEAEKLASQARESDKPLAESFDDREDLRVVTPDRFSWMTRMGTGQVTMSQIRGVPDAGLEFVSSDFMRDVFALDVGDVGVATNQPRTYVYVVRVAEQTPSDDILRQLFLMSGYRSPELNRLALEEQAGLFQEWYEELEREMGVQWQQVEQASL